MNYQQQQLVRVIGTQAEALRQTIEEAAQAGLNVDLHIDGIYMNPAEEDTPSAAVMSLQFYEEGQKPQRHEPKPFDSFIPLPCELTKAGKAENGILKEALDYGGHTHPAGSVCPMCHGSCSLKDGPRNAAAYALSEWAKVPGGIPLEIQKRAARRGL